MLRRSLTLAALVCLAACEAPLPPFEYQGEHVVVASDTVDQVCAGTLAYLDREYERVSEGLGLEFASEPLRVAILDEAQASRVCSSGRSCATWIQNRHTAVVRTREVKRIAAHEMVHVRLGRRRSGSVPMFSEGIAEAFAPAQCPPRGRLPIVGQLLRAEHGSDLNGRAYYVSGELVTYLKQVHGRDSVLNFIEGLVRPELLAPTPSRQEVTDQYHEYFGTHLSEDLWRSPRPADLLTPDELGCDAPMLEEHNRQLSLQATLDCDSVRVENDFENPTQAFVEWGFSNPSNRSFRFHGQLPPETSLELIPCACDIPGGLPNIVWEGSEDLMMDVPEGQYTVRWRGPVGLAEELDVTFTVTQ